MKSDKRVLRLALAGSLLLAALALPGCVGYQLGTMLPPGIRSVHVPTFINKTGEPLVETLATQSTIREFQRDGTLIVRTAEDADSIVQVTLLEMKQLPLRYQRTDADTTREYKLVITAEVRFKDLKTDKVVVDGVSVDGEYNFQPGADLTSAKRTAIPEACRDLAHNVVEKIVEHWPDN
jgi:hypothetical protein